jgi:2-keto-4-pentenoate hydratase/2-oxohepta-3-ene-1,7-dioic acid hydratase in catechol pathway
MIGHRAQAVKPEDAASHIFGYTCATDVTAVEVFNKDSAFERWTRAKSLTDSALWAR